MSEILSLADAQAELSTVLSAIQDIYMGKRRTHLKVGSGAFSREYNYSDPEKLLEILIAERDRLRNYIASFNSEVKPVFRSHSNIPLIVGKF